MIYNKAFNLQVCSVTLKKLDGKLYQLWSCLHAGKQWLEMLSLGIRIVFIVASNRKYKQTVVGSQSWHSTLCASMKEQPLKEGTTKLTHHLISLAGLAHILSAFILLQIKVWHQMKCFVLSRTLKLLFLHVVVHVVY